MVKDEKAGIMASVFILQSWISESDNEFQGREKYRIKKLYVWLYDFLQKRKIYDRLYW